MKYDFDFIVIGAGSGGVRASRIAAKHGARVAVIESSDLGGTCVNLGCIPKKLFTIAADFHDIKRDAAGYGFEIDGLQFQWQTLLDNKNKEINRLNHIYEKLLLDAGVTILRGFATFVDEHTVRVNDQNYQADFILIATGSEADKPDIPGQELAITSNEAFHLSELPKRAIVVGGGYIGVEFAGIFHGLNVDTTLIHRGDLLLRGFDQSIREFVGQEITKKGIHLMLGTDIHQIEKVDGQLLVRFNDYAQGPLTTDLILFATGRRPRTHQLQLNKIGLKLRKNESIIVNDAYQTNIPHIYAIGDVIGGPQLTPLAIAEGHIVADNLFAHMNRRLQSHLLPTAVFCKPNVATVGLTEIDARKQYEDIAIFQSTFRALKHTLTGSDEKNFMKLIVDKKSNKILGAHMVGENAGEIIQGFAAAIQAGATKADFDNTLAIHPTIAEEFVLMR
ncbi:MAG: glutathione-disulfide reductase [Gammaproteobacteria bacterium]